MWVAYTLLAVLGVVVAAILVALWAPLDLRITLVVPGRAAVRARWLFGLVRFDRELRRSGPRPVRPEPEAQEAKRGAEPRKRTRFERPRRGARIAGGLRGIDGLATAIGRLFGRLIRSVRWRGCFGRLRLGFVDPADTGEACGLIYPILVFVPRDRGIDLQFDPEWGGPAFELDMRGDVRLVPMDVCAALVRFLLSPPALRGIKVIAWDSRPETS